MPNPNDNLFACISQFRQPPEILQEHLVAHLEWLSELDKQGRVVASGAQEPLGAGGVTIFSAANRAEMDSILITDPFYVNGVSAHWLFEFKKNDAPYTGRLMEFFFSEEFNSQNSSS